MLSVADPLKTIRRLLLGLAAFGLAGVATDLVFIEHYEDVTMLIPLGTIALAFGSIAFHAARGSRVSGRLLRVVMCLLAIVGGIGVLLHYRGSLEFQVDMDPTLSTSQLFWKVMHMKAPPTLAPGVLVQLGLLGLISTYRDPAFSRSDRLTHTGA